MRPSDGFRAELEANGVNTNDPVVHVHAAAFYVACLKSGYHDEAAEFAEWYLETFDHDLES